jgi:prepilin-type N-terminal cleavage/methylation domain-containing protein
MRQSPVRPFRFRQEGFTLVELLAVAVIVLVFGLFLIPYTQSVLDRTKAARAERDLREIQVALERFYADHGHYPRRLADLLSFTDAMGRSYAYLKHNVDFRSPYSTKQKETYYLYAVDSNRAETPARAYLLADPGPLATSKTNAYLGRTGPVPAGRKPTDYAHAWACWLSETKLSLDFSVELCTVQETSLSAYRERSAAPGIRTEG